MPAYLRIPYRVFLVSLLAAVAPAPARAAEEEAAEPVSFRQQIAPILANNCLACHGPKDTKGDFQLDTFENLTVDGYITPGDPEDSHLLSMITEEDEELRMPKEAREAVKSPEPEGSLISRWAPSTVKLRQ